MIIDVEQKRVFDWPIIFFNVFIRQKRVLSYDVCYMLSCRPVARFLIIIIIIINDEMIAWMNINYRSSLFYLSIKWS